MKFFHLTVSFDLEHDSPAMDRLLSRFQQSTLSDGVLGLGCPGRVALQLSYLASSFEDAASLMIKEVRELVDFQDQVVVITCDP